jgi:predicted aldo/keto reductase-like oxidoreductase
MKMRDKVVIATKEMVSFQRRGLSGAKAADALMKMVEASLGRLQTDYVDIVYIHDVTTPEEAVHPGFLEGMRKLKEQGKIRFSGFSTHMNMAACMDAAVREGSADVILTSFNYALSADSALLESSGKRAGDRPVAMRPVLQDWYRTSFPGAAEILRGGIVPGVLKWALGIPSYHGVPRFTTFQQLDEDMAVASDLAFTPEETRYLKDRNVRLTLNTCIQCGRCAGTCPRGADIPSLMRTHMYMTCYGNLSQAKHALDCIPASRGPGRCGGCDECTAACVRELPVSERIGELKALLA